MKVLVLYSSFDGQTRRIAQRVAEVVVRAGHAIRLMDAEDPRAAEAIREDDAVIVGAAIRYGHFRRSLEKLVRAQRPVLAAAPNAFFSVCLSAGGPGAKPELARQYVDDFCERTGWEPHDVATFAGALQYSRYNFFIRFMMRMIVGHAGGDTDTTRDYEYTDWAAVERFAARFAAGLEPLPLAA